MFFKAVFCGCVELSIYGVKGYKSNFTGLLKLRIVWLKVVIDATNLHFQVGYNIKISLPLYQIPAAI